MDLELLQIFVHLCVNFVAYNGLTAGENRKYYFNYRHPQWVWTDITSKILCPLYLRNPVFIPKAFLCAVKIKSDGIVLTVSVRPGSRKIFWMQKRHPFIAGQNKKHSTH